MLRAGAAIAVALVCVSCTSEPIVKNFMSVRSMEGRADGAIIAYYYPKAIWKLTASFDKATGTVSLKADGKPTILPDTDGPINWLSYSHAALSDDNITVQVDNSMLSLVSSKSSDQTVKVVEAANALLTQVGTTRQALEKISFAAPVDKGKGDAELSLWEKAGCTGNLSSEVVLDLTHIGKPAKQVELLWGPYCSLDVRISVKRLGVATYKAADVSESIVQSSQHLEDLQGICARAVCFRPSQVVQVTATVTLNTILDLGKDGNPTLDKENRPVIVAAHPVTVPKAQARTQAQVPLRLSQEFYPLTVPVASRIPAFVEFGRRAFVENQTSLAFKEGVVSEFKSTDPSIVANALTLTSDLLKTVVLTVAIVK